MSGKFDPFEDRLSRDVRNALSGAFAQAINDMSMRPVYDTSEIFFKKGIEDWHREYIEKRLSLYAKALRTIVDENNLAVLERALVLWDLALFFEVHEILEHAWFSAHGLDKLILQAMIRAAGVYIHLDHGNRKGAQKMAARAIETLAANREYVSRVFDTDLLLDKLRRLDPVPPKLRAKR